MSEANGTLGENVRSIVAEGDEHRVAPLQGARKL